MLALPAGSSRSIPVISSCATAFSSSVGSTSALSRRGLWPTTCVSALSSVYPCILFPQHGSMISSSRLVFQRCPHPLKINFWSMLALPVVFNRQRPPIRSIMCCHNHASLWKFAVAGRLIKCTLLIRHPVLRLPSRRVLLATSLEVTAMKCGWTWQIIGPPSVTDQVRASGYRRLCQVCFSTAELQFLNKIYSISNMFTTYALSSSSNCSSKPTSSSIHTRFTEST